MRTRRLGVKNQSSTVHTSSKYDVEIDPGSSDILLTMLIIMPFLE
jgi:hypothetical protein